MPANLRISYTAIAPELILAITAVIVLAISVFIKPRRGSYRHLLFGPVAVSLVGLAAAFLALIFKAGNGSAAPFFSGSFTQDGYAIFFKMLFLIAGMMIVLLSIEYSRKLSNSGEFYGLLVATITAMCFMASATDLVTLYISIEFLSLTSYVLAGYLKQEPRSNEAAMKYFLYGAACSATMLYGLSLLYGMVGSTSYAYIAAKLHTLDSENILLLAGSMVLVGFGFKIAMVPFHQWSPDTYEGAPTPVTAFLSVAPKAAGFAVLIRMFTGIIPDHMTHWPGIIALGAAASMTLGNLAAIWQTSAKRMLAYSSIAQAGYVLIGLAAWGSPSGWSIPGILVYLVSYLFMNLGAFAIVLAIENRTGSEEINSYAGMSQRSPWLAALMVIFMLSLAGIPPTAGFVGKMLVFGAAISYASVKPWLAWLAGLGIVNSVISLYYYFNVIRVMYISPAVDKEPIPISPSLRLALGISLVATLAILVFMGPVLNLAQNAMAYAFH